MYGLIETIKLYTLPSNKIQVKNACKNVEIGCKNVEFERKMVDRGKAIEREQEQLSFLVSLFDVYNSYCWEWPHKRQGKWHSETSNRTAAKNSLVVWRHTNILPIVSAEGMNFLANSPFELKIQFRANAHMTVATGTNRYLSFIAKETFMAKGALRASHFKEK